MEHLKEIQHYLAGLEEEVHTELQPSLAVQEQVDKEMMEELVKIQSV